MALIPASRTNASPYFACFGVNLSIGSICVDFRHKGPSQEAYSKPFASITHENERRTGPVAAGGYKAKDPDMNSGECKGLHERPSLSILRLSPPSHFAQIDWQSAQFCYPSNILSMSSRTGLRYKRYSTHVGKTFMVDPHLLDAATRAPIQSRITASIRYSLSMKEVALARDVHRGRWSIRNNYRRDSKVVWRTVRKVEINLRQGGKRLEEVPELLRRMKAIVCTRKTTIFLDRGAQSAIPFIHTHPDTIPDASKDDEGEYTYLRIIFLAPRLLRWPAGGHPFPET
ncbi:hypothetical protein NMY22_g2026 [Coprinellus aureogranulatus]|nr:hypothetical protein NMY22_g2026 [Coprinellus aureogranulatus]